MRRKILTTLQVPSSEKEVILSEALAEFAPMMQAKLDRKYERYGDSYFKMHHRSLLKMLREHVDKAIERYETPRPKDKILNIINGTLKSDVVDVANIAMMIALNEKRRRG